jgi:secondary thiamine-phosphate synthase enzyme
MIEQYQFKLPAKPRGFHIITQEVLKNVGVLPEKGIFHLFIQHTSAAITINEDADATVRIDFENIFNRLVKEDEPYYQHTVEGSDDMPAHVKAALIGNSISIPITNHQFNLGTWQGIYLCEFRNRAGSRNFVATIYGG